MGKIVSPWQRPGLETSAGDHERRINILERESGKCCGSGLVVGDYVEIAFGIGGLRAYWRLGESVSPFLDTSGYSPGTPDNLTRVASGVAMTTDVTGALPAVYDDGAVMFNYAGTTSSGNAAADYLTGAAGADGRFNFNPLAPGGESMSVAAWVKPSASANTWIGGIVTAMNTVAASPSYDGGWALYLNWPARTATFWRGGAGPVAQSATSSALTAGEWTHLAATYDGTSIRLYVDGALAATTASAVDLPGINEAATVGQMVPALGTYRGRFYGAIDEAAVWLGVLTPTQIAALAASGAASAIALAGYVYTADGVGGASWEPPTIEVSY